MFLTARILFLNEEDYIQYILRSIYPAVECIVIVEGCIEQYGKGLEYAPEGLSTDRSEELINAFIQNEDPDGKVIYHRHGFARNYGELANVAVALIPGRTTHFLNVDGDEVYSPMDIARTKQLFKIYPGLCGVAVDRLHFYLDFWTLRRNKKAEKLGPTGGTMFRRFYPGETYPDKGAEHNPRLDGERLVEYWLPWWEDDVEKGIRLAKEKGFLGITWRRKMMPQFHYGWVREERKMIERLLQTYRRVDAYSGRGLYSSMDDEELIEFIRLYHPMFTGIDDPDNVLEEYLGKHPEVMKEHPFHELYKEDIGWLSPH